MAYTIKQNLVDKLDAVNGVIIVDGTERTTGFTIPDGSRVEIKLTGYEFEDKGGSPMGGGYKVSFGVSSPMGGTTWWARGKDLSIAVNTYFSGTESMNFTVIAHRTTDPEPEPFTGYVVESDLMSLLLTNNLTMTVNGEPVSLGMEIHDGSSVVVETQETDQFVISESGKTSFGVLSPMGGATYWDMGESERQAVNSSFTGRPNMKFTATVIPAPTDSAKGINNVFRLDDDTAKNFIRSEYKTFDGETWTDHKKQVIGMLDLPFTISEDFVVEPQRPINLGNYATGLNGDLLESDLYRINLGSINVEDETGNSLSRINTVCIIHLPYTESLTIDSEYVIGETISVEYVVNLYDGLTVANISSSKIDGVILSQNIDLNVAYPFARGDYMPAMNDPHNIVMSVFNGVNTPYIEVMRNTAILTDGFFTVPVIDETTIGNCDGFVRVENVDLKTTATTQEKERIISQLNRGVIL